MRPLETQSDSELSEGAVRGRASGSQTDGPRRRLSADELLQGLARFGHSQFRPGQREAIETLLDKGCLLLVAPTGGGKSLTYQLPATLLGGTTLVISPLVALMHDQVLGLRAQGVPATYLASTLTSDESDRRIAEFRRGNYRVVYVTPERIALPGFRNLVRRLHIPLIAVDEAHCISEWGHDFRPEYMQIGNFIAGMPSALVLACTATATPVVRDEICHRLGLGPKVPQVLRGFARPNLAPRVQECKRGADQEAVIDRELREATGGPSQTSGAAIIYAPTRRSCEEQSERLRREGWRVGCYHAGLAAESRARAQQEFSAKQLDVVVATNAFGMGIDRADVRAVLHMSPPGSIEAYYQEVGRAGRDGEAARGLLLVSSQDLPQRRRMIEGDIDGRRPSAAIVEHKWNLFLELMRWAEGGSCRHDAILRYFGDEGELLSGCGLCDVCQGLSEADDESDEDRQLIVRKALSGVARVHMQYGLGMAVKLLRGSKDERLQRSGLDRVKTFAILASEREAWLTQLLRRCVTAGWVNFTAGDRPLVYLTEEGREVMAGRRPVRMMLPARKASSKSSGAQAKSSRTRRSEQANAELTGNELELFEQLRKVRMDLARSEGVPPYVVASDRSLRDLARLRPRCRDELLMAHGIGEGKAEKYGEALLSAIAG